MVRAAIRAGLDAMVLSDHDRLAPTARLARLNAKFAPFRVFGGIEAYSNNTPVEDEARILALAAHVGIQVLSNSDAHHVDRIGAYRNELSAEPSDDAELLAALRHGVVVGRRG